MLARIIKIISNQYTVISDTLGQLPAFVAGKVRLQGKPLVGDLVEIDLLEGRYCIEKIITRKNELIRPAIANVDQAMIVMSASQPDFSNVLVDRLIFLISYYDIEPIIVITKMDLVTKDNIVYDYIADYRKSNYQVIEIAKENGIEQLKQCLKDKITVLTGQSGVGKSSIINKIDSSFTLNTQEISKSMGRGKHTTRHYQLYPVAGGWLADTPGFSSLDFSRFDAKTILEKTKDFQINGKCRFNDCHHINEPDCAIKNAVNDGIISKLRYQNYLDIVDLCNQRKQWEL